MFVNLYETDQTAHFSYITQTPLAAKQARSSLTTELGTLCGSDKTCCEPAYKWSTSKPRCLWISMRPISRLGNSAMNRQETRLCNCAFISIDRKIRTCFLPHCRVVQRKLTRVTNVKKGFSRYTFHVAQILTNWAINSSIALLSSLESFAFLHVNNGTTIYVTIVSSVILSPRRLSK